jgi:hypothetical protein
MKDDQRAAETDGAHSEATRGAAAQALAAWLRDTDLPRDWNFIGLRRLAIIWFAAWDAATAAAHATEPDVVQTEAMLALEGELQARQDEIDRLRAASRHPGGHRGAPEPQQRGGER